MSRTRRTRFEVNAYDRNGQPVRQHILAYSATSVEDYFYRRGYSQIAVDRIQRGALTDDGQSEPWALNRAALARMIERLGIEYPVEVKLTGHRGGRNGAHSFTARYGTLYKDARLDTASGGMKHVITVKNYIGAAQAERTLRHELQHAVQAERVAAGVTGERAKFMRWKKAYRDGITYRDKPLERDARAAENMHPDIALARPRSAR